MIGRLSALPAGALRTIAGRPGREGWILLSFARETSGGRRAGPESDSGNDGKPGSKSGGRKKRADDPQIGSALRSVYQRTVDEDIPPDLLDLLGKLG